MTPKKKLILDLILKGNTQKQIAEATGITVGTVKFHITEIYKIYKVKRRHELIAKLGLEPASPIDLNKTYAQHLDELREKIFMAFKAQGFTSRQAAKRLKVHMHTFLSFDRKVKLRRSSKRIARKLDKNYTPQALPVGFKL